MNREFAEHFAKNWLDAWNAHDLPRILAHYTDDFEMSSPVIIQVTGNPEGRLQGKQAVGAYWTKALTLFPNLRFEPLCTLIGVNSIVIHYVGATGQRVAEVFHFNEAGLVFRAQAHYEP
ncbi:nuclear transport factor 2 family protein [Methylomicrobium sp. Wu6]|uniref:nuclear transport factor 2 family protein n=1 Tax=Methylomicrobium sp. Wu6 TaxID=3107928 RepID=UPI002DD62749|nr:nuclear transport factor 2 family protein [Methylomicrobium sp. Wu6]MEC4747918.1 nuclear transport factor 2 family protein [Methylomicrobium sp. Wu6]